MEVLGPTEHFQMVCTWEMVHGFAKLHNYILGLMSMAQPSPKGLRAYTCKGLKAYMPTGLKH